MKTKQTFTSIEREHLTTVSGGAARVAAAARSSDFDTSVKLKLTQIGDSLKEAGKGGNDQMMPMMMMMMMMGGLGGGGGGSVAPATAPAPTGAYVRINVRR